MRVLQTSNSTKADIRRPMSAIRCRLADRRGRPIRLLVAIFVLFDFSNVTTRIGSSTAVLSENHASLHSRHVRGNSAQTNSQEK